MILVIVGIIIICLLVRGRSSDKTGNQQYTEGAICHIIRCEIRMLQTGISASFSEITNVMHFCGTPFNIRDVHTFSFLYACGQPIVPDMAYLVICVMWQALRFEYFNLESLFNLYNLEVIKRRTCYIQR